MLERTTFQTVTSLRSLSPGSISHPFSNDGECPEELHVLNWSQVRALPASAVAQSVEQLKRFSIPLSPSPLSYLPQSWRMPERTTSGNQRVQISPRSHAAKSLHPCRHLLSQNQSPQMVTNADGTTCLRSLRSGVRIPPVPPFQFPRDRSSAVERSNTFHQSLSSPPFLQIINQKS